MESPLSVIDNEKDFAVFQSLLRSSGLPADDLSFERDLLVGYVEDGTMVGTGGLEIYEDYGLLRSLSVRLGTRGKALGTAITEHLIAKGKERNLKGIYLLTETAHGFFLRKGFVDIERDKVPTALQASSEFSNVCGSTAFAMHLKLVAT
ncbi:MAG TPA: arsenic resistance N-acetyltransferase ArsN2 [Chryseolinea sp.]|nr:arsenic resistance N-acetyltransferase ArsN2 [Chryseolinea sp.]